MHQSRKPARAARPLLAVCLLGSALLCGCAGGGTSTDGGGGAIVSRTPSERAGGAPSEPFGSVEIPDVAPQEQRLQIGMDATRSLNDFVASDRVVIGEHTTVDMSATPFLAMSAFAVNPDDVHRSEQRDDVNGLVTITLTNRTGVKTHLPSLPRVEIGGLMFVGVERLVLRYSLFTDRQRPISLRAVAERNAVYQQAAAGRTDRGGRVVLEMDVSGTGDAARFRENVRVDP